MENENIIVLYLKASSVVILSVVPFIFSLNADFVFDDSEAILNNKDVYSDVHPMNAFYNDFWGTPINSNISHKSYRPLTILSFRFNKYFSGNKLIASHFKLTNILCHTVCCLLFYKWLNTTIQLTHRTTKKTLKHVSNNVDKAYLSTLLFAIHPIHTEAVSGIVGRADLLAAIFFFLALILYDKCASELGIQSHVKNTTKWSFGCNSAIFFSAILCAVVSMLFKETGITVLVMCIIHDIIIVEEINPRDLVTDIVNYFYNKLTINQIATGKKKTIPKYVMLKKFNKKIIYRTVMLTCCAVVSLFFRWRVIGKGGPAVFSDIDNPAAFSKSFLTRILSYSYIYFMNVALLVWPQWLCFDWSMGCIPLLKSVQDFRLIFIVLFYVFLVCCIRIVLDRRRLPQFRRLWCVGMCLLLVPFLPASNLVVRVGFVIAERVLYLPSAGFCLLTVMGFEKFCYYKSGAYKKFAYALFALVILTFTMRTHQRAAEWSNESTLFYSGLNVCPLNAKVHYNIAKVNQLHLPDIAEFEYREAIRLNPEYYNAMNNLGNLLRVKGRFQEAETLFLEALSIKEDFPAAWMNLGVLLAGRGQPDIVRAEAAYRRAISYRPNYADCYYNIGNMYLSEHRNDEAFSAWLSAINIAPTHELAWTNLLAMLDNTGQTERAMQYLPTALERLPESGAVHFTCGNLLGRTGQLEEAEEHFLLALRLLGEKVRPIHYSNLVSRVLAILDLKVRLSSNVKGPTLAAFHLILSVNTAHQMFMEKNYHTVDLNPNSVSLALQKLAPEHIIVMTDRFACKGWSSPRRHSYQGILYHRWKKYRKAEEMYKKALKLDPTLKHIQEHLQIVKSK